MTKGLKITLAENEHRDLIVPGKVDTTSRVGYGTIKLSLDGFQAALKATDEAKPITEAEEADSTKVDTSQDQS